MARVSRYENGRVAPASKPPSASPEPSTSAVDYLIAADATRRPLQSLGNKLNARLAGLSQLDDDVRATILAVIGAITTKTKLRLIAGGAS